MVKKVSLSIAAVALLVAVLAVLSMRPSTECPGQFAVFRQGC